MKAGQNNKYDIAKTLVWSRPNKEAPKRKFELCVDLVENA